jgi:hypothetical protein
VLARPRNGVAPAVLGRLGDDAVVDLEREVGLGLEGLDGLRGASGGGRLQSGNGRAVFMGSSRATLGSVKTPTCTAR